MCYGGEVGRSLVPWRKERRATRLEHAGREAEATSRDLSCKDFEELECCFKPSAKC